VIELYQAEWCPHSRKVRQRLTELGVDFVSRQVEASPRERRAMRKAVGAIEIPTLVTEDGDVLTGDDAILEWLDGAYEVPDGAAEHRAKALEKAGLPR
jgi:glutaredoxin 3